MFVLQEGNDQKVSDSINHSAPDSPYPFGCTRSHIVFPDPRLGRHCAGATSLREPGQQTELSPQSVPAVE